MSTSRWPSRWHSSSQTRRSKPHDSKWTPSLQVSRPHLAPCHAWWWWTSRYLPIECQFKWTTSKGSHSSYSTPRYHCRIQSIKEGVIIAPGAKDDRPTSLSQGRTQPTKEAVWGSSLASYTNSHSLWTPSRVSRGTRVSKARKESCQVLLGVAYQVRGRAICSHPWGDGFVLSIL